MSSNTIQTIPTNTRSGLTTLLLSLAIISYPILNYISYAFAGFALLSSIAFWIHNQPTPSKRNDLRQWLYPLLLSVLSGILFLFAGRGDNIRSALTLIVGGVFMTITLSTIVAQWQQRVVFYSFFIACILTFFLGTDTVAWAQGEWQELNLVPWAVVLIYVLFYVLGNSLVKLSRLSYVYTERYALKTIIGSVALLITAILAAIALIMYWGNTPFLLALVPLFLFPHIYRWIGLLQGMVARLSLWVVVAIMYLFGVSFVGHVIDDFYSPQYCPSKPYELATINGRGYQHDTSTLAYQRGLYHDIYICQEELEKEWNRYSSLPLYSSVANASGLSLYDVLCRYLASGGHRRDSVGLTFLDTEDIRAIEHGATSIKLRGRWYPYRTLWKALEQLEAARMGDTSVHSFLYSSWQSFRSQSGATHSPLGIVASTQRWGTLPVSFLILGIVGYLLFLAIKCKRRIAWHAICLLCIFLTMGYSFFSTQGLLFWILAIGWLTVNDRYELPANEAPQKEI